MIRLIVISTSRHDKEHSFLEKCEFAFKRTRSWHYASSNGKEHKYDELVSQFSFVLYNQDKFKKIKGFCKTLNKNIADTDNILIYRHNNNNYCPNCDELKSLIKKAEDCRPFSHLESDKNWKTIQTFMVDAKII